MQTLDSYPNCVFDVSGPLRQFTKQTRALGFMAKMAELSMVRDQAVHGKVLRRCMRVAVCV